MTSFLLFLPFFLPLLLFLLLSTSTLSIPCSSHHHCDDINPNTFDYCTHNQQCLNLPAWSSPTSHLSSQSIPHTIRQSTGIQITNRADLLKQVNRPRLTRAEKLRIIDTSALFVAEFNPHRFLHLNFLNVDPVAKLESLAAIVRSPQSANQTNINFHAAVTAIYQTMDDFHTVYIPSMLLERTQLSLNLITFHEYYDTGTTARKYTATIPKEVMLSDPLFVDGVEILEYDNVEMDRKVVSIGRTGHGSNFPARLADGLRLLDSRQLIFDALPSSDSVEIKFRAKTGEIRTIALMWVYFYIPPAPPASPEPTPFNGDEMPDITNQPNIPAGQMILGVYSHPDTSPLDPFSLHAQRYAALANHSPFKKRQPNLGWIPTSSRVGKSKVTVIDVAEDFQHLFGAQTIRTTRGVVGHIQIFTFNTVLSQGLFLELIRVLKLMPSAGLIMDIRSNPGGDPDFAKIFLELVSDRTIVANPTNVRATNTLDRLMDSALAKISAGNPASAILERFITRFRSGLKTAVRVGEPFSGSGPPVISSLVANLRVKQVYFGPLITVVNAQSYSAADIFASMVVDSKISKLVGTADNVGAGGAGALSYSSLQYLFPDILDPLPAGADFSTAYIRYYRTGKRAGAIVENFGIKPNVRYYPTLDDILKEDCDLLEFLAKKLLS